MLPKLVTAKSRRNRKHKMFLDLRSVRFDCQLESEENLCRTNNGRDEVLNCVNECVSRLCYEEVYREKPLEPGEIDLERAKQFSDCATAELRRKRYEQRYSRTT